MARGIALLAWRSRAELLNFAVGVIALLLCRGPPCCHCALGPGFTMGNRVSLASSLHFGGQPCPVFCIPVRGSSVATGLDEASDGHAAGVSGCTRSVQLLTSFRAADMYGLGGFD